MGSPTINGSGRDGEPTVKEVPVVVIGSSVHARERIESLTRVPALDGLRGMAILLVLLFHFYYYSWIQTYLNYFPTQRLWALADYGWCGVDLFFGLSGFLITSILFRTKESPQYFRSFYGRRVLRIFPLYFACVLPLFHLNWFPSAQHWVGSLPSSREVWFVTFLANWKIPLWRDRFLTHFWSLCVEEQFYFVWPAIVFFTNKRQFPWICFAGITFSLAAGFWFEFAGFGRDFIRYASFPRTEALLFGALIAWLFEQGKQFVVTRYLYILLPAGLGLMIIFASQPYYFRGLYVLETFAAGFGWATVLFYCLAKPHSLLSRSFEGPLLRFLGKHSYAIYCLNFVVFYYAGWYARRMLGITYLSEATPLSVLALFLLMIGACVFAGFLTWHILEKHFLRLKRYFPYSYPDSSAHC